MATMIGLPPTALEWVNTTAAKFNMPPTILEWVNIVAEALPVDLADIAELFIDALHRAPITTLALAILLGLGAVLALASLIAAAVLVALICVTILVLLAALLALFVLVAHTDSELPADNAPPQAPGIPAATSTMTSSTSILPPVYAGCQGTTGDKAGATTCMPDEKATGFAPLVIGGEMDDEMCSVTDIDMTSVFDKCPLIREWFKEGGDRRPGKYLEMIPKYQQFYMHSHGLDKH